MEMIFDDSCVMRENIASAVRSYFAAACRGSRVVLDAAVRSEIFRVAHGSDRVSDLQALLTAARARTRRARDIADGSRHNEQLHRLSMTTVFVLEDLEFALAQMVEARSRSRHSEDPGETAI